MLEEDGEEFDLKNLKSESSDKIVTPDEDSSAYKSKATAMVFSPDLFRMDKNLPVEKNFKKSPDSR